MDKQNKKRQPKLFETFQCGMMTLQCVKGPNCYNCAFYVRKGSSTLCDRPCSEEWDLSCGKRYREDEVSVVFERVSPFASKRCPRWGSACTREQLKQIYKHITENNHETD